MTLPLSWDLQAALFAWLSADSDLQNVVGTPARVYDAVPTDAIFPFITLGEVRTRHIAAVPAAREHDLRIYAHSQWGGRREAKDIVERVVARLNGNAFALTDHRLVQCRFIFSDIIRRTEPETFQAVMRFRAVTEEVAA